MDKKIIAVNFFLFSTLFLLVINSYAQKPIIHDKIVFNEFTDSIVSVEGKEILVRFEGWGSGIVRIRILVYLRDTDILKGRWILLCSNLTNTTKVSMRLNQERREMIFKSKSGKKLMTLPFDIFNFSSDW